MIEFIDSIILTAAKLTIIFITAKQNYKKNSYSHNNQATLLI